MRERHIYPFAALACAWLYGRWPLVAMFLLGVLSGQLTRIILADMEAQDEGGGDLDARGN